MKESTSDALKVAGIIILVLAFIVGSAILATSLKTGVYEYTDYSGEVKEAVLCDDPYNDVPFCKLEDGTKVYDIKTYRRIK